MHPLKKIIVGYDLRGGGEIALKSAAVLAQRCGAALRLVHVVEPLHSLQKISHPRTSPCTLEEICQNTGAKLRALAGSRELAHLEVEYEVRRGKPFVELILACRAWQADLIVVGTVHERQAHLLGSTSARVVRKAMVPVVVAKRILSAEAKIFLVPTDFSECAQKAAEEAVMLAKNFHSRVVFLHVVDLYPAYAVYYTDDYSDSVALPAPKPGEIESRWQAFASALPLKNVAWETRTVEGQAAAEIFRQAAQSHADLIVMGTHGRTGLDYMLLGSVAEKVVRRATCPVLTIRPQAFQFAMP